MTTAVGWRGIADDRDDSVAIDAGSLIRGSGRRLLVRVMRPHARRLVVSGLLIVIQTLAALSVPWLVGKAIDNGVRPLISGGGNTTALEWIVLAILVIAVAGSAAEYGFLRLSGTIGQEMLYDLRTMVFARFGDLSIAFYERFTSGRVIARLTSDVDAIAEMLQSALTSVITGLLQVVLIAVALLLLDWRIGLVVLLVSPVLVVLSRWFQRRSMVAYREVRNAIALVIAYFAESLRGINAVQTFRRERRNQEIFEGLNARYREASIESGVLASTFGPGIDGIGRVTTAAVLMLGAYLVLQHSMSIGVLTAAVLYVQLLFSPMQDLSQFYNVFQSAAAAFDKLGAVMDEPASVPQPASPVRLLDPQGSVEFRDVSFRYSRDGPAVLSDINLLIPAGQTVALVGQTGAGKSTLARLMARFYDPSSGEVLLDGHDLRTLADTDLRAGIVAVTQEAFLFSGSIEENIAFGRRGATRAEVEAAARAVGAHDFIAQLPEGYDTQVKKGGGRLSSGQRQLVAFARAFLSDPRVLILDEATSSLDIPTERAVQRALRQLLHARTAVIIAHRLSTVEIADRVLVMSAGRIIEEGTPAELVATGGDYQRLHAAWVASLA